MKVYLCRHGETIWNARGKIQGIGDAPLTEVGVAQAKELASRLSNKNPVAIYCSSSGRAVKTAEIIAAKHNKKPIQVFGLHEIDCGKFEGLTFAEREKLYAKEDNERSKDKINNPFPEGENYVMVKERLLVFIEMIKKKHPSDEIIVVGHQGSGRTLAAMLMGYSDEELLKIAFPHGTIYEIELNKEKKISYTLDGKTNTGVLYRNKEAMARA